MLHRPIRNIQDFLLSTYFADGIRITIGVLCPSLIMAQFGMLQYGMTLSLGALCISVVDSPGPIVHRRNAMLITTALLAIISILVGLTNQSIIISGVLLVFCSFFFSMFFVYGVRAASIGTAVLLIMVLSIDDIRPWKEVLFYTLLIFFGSVWYTLLSYLVYRLRPYRLLQQTLSESVQQISEFLRAKAKFYRENTDYEKNYAELLQLQVHVHEKQDEVRELLFKTRQIIRESTPESRFLLLVFVDTVDLFEQVMSTYYNYKELHLQFDSSGILRRYERLINQIADALDNVAFSLKSGGTPHIDKNLLRGVEKLKYKITLLEKNKNQQYNTLGLIALKNIEVNIENILGRVRTITGYFNKKEKKNLKKREIDVDRFVTKQNFDFKLFFENLTFSSSAFRHSLRVAIVMFIGFTVAKILNFDHSYWILLTILVISKPGFSLTKQRNFERLIGTVVGAFIGMGILVYIHDKNTLFVILLFCMIGSYSFQRKNYVVSVLFMTPYILVLFDFLGMGSLSIARERIYDTLIGSGIALLASYSLFPNWEHEKLKQAMIDVINANRNYFNQVTLLYFDKNNHTSTNYKVARKEVYVSTSNLASLFQRMFSEPKSKQLYIKELHQFTVLNHSLSSYIATLSLYNKEHDFFFENFEEFKPVSENTIYLLNEAADNITLHKDEVRNVPLIRRKKAVDMSDENPSSIVAEQFESIQKVAYDIFKLAEKIKI
ncbi:MAG: FUSC family protein [Flavobacterium sp.]|nr:MAG: FUSC family protein [Flavobacterium sp.]